MVTASVSRIAKVMGYNPVEPWYFSGQYLQLLNLQLNCEDHCHFRSSYYKRNVYEQHKIFKSWTCYYEFRRYQGSLFPISWCNPVFPFMFRFSSIISIFGLVTKGSSCSPPIFQRSCSAFEIKHHLSTIWNVTRTLVQFVILLAFSRLCSTSIKLGHTSDGSRDGDGDGSYQSNVQVRTDWRVPRNITPVCSILTTIKMTDEKKLLLLVFILLRFRRRRHKLTHLRRRSIWVRVLLGTEKL